MDANVVSVLLGGALATLGGVVATYLTDRLGAKRDERQHEHERELAADARHQERLHRTYVELLLPYLSYAYQHAKTLRPTWETPEPLPPFDRERYREMEAYVTAYGSPHVRRLLDEWSVWPNKIENADSLIRITEHAKSPSAEMAQEAELEHRSIGGYLDDMDTADSALRAQVQRELGTPEHDG